MLYMALVLSAIYLLLANRVARHARYPFLSILGWGALFTIGPIFLVLFLPPLAWQTGLLLVAVPIWHRYGKSPASFVWLSAAATALAYVWPVWTAIEYYREVEQLRAQYPLESMDARLPRAPLPPEEPLSDATLDRLARLETQLDMHQWTWRKVVLERLHQRTVHTFISSPGFGVTRMSYISRSSLEGPAEPTPKQPGARGSALESLGEWSVVDQRGDLDHMHDGALVDFLSAEWLGLVRDRTRVAGFQGHQLRSTPAPWKVQTLDLIGLVLHEEPTAYVSDHLPRMEELRTAPTRPIDAFEKEGLAALRRGDDFYIGRTEDDLRMIGAVRSTKQCLTCHGGQRGDLLGTFSYRLRPTSDK